MVQKMLDLEHPVVTSKVFSCPFFKQKLLKDKDIFE